MGKSAIISTNPKCIIGIRIERHNIVIGQTVFTRKQLQRVLLNCNPPRVAIQISPDEFSIIPLIVLVFTALNWARN